MCTRLCKRSGEKMFRDMGSKIYVFSEYGEWDNEYKRVIVL